MRYVETNTSLYRMVSVVKQRESAHDPSIRRFIIDENGLHLTRRFHRHDHIVIGARHDPAGAVRPDTGTRT